MITENYRVVQLDLLKKFIAMCEKHDIPYYVSGGTLLGAVRNGHFIPWDDDMDVVIFREDYERFIEAVGKELSLPYYLQIEDSMETVYWGCMRIGNADTTAASVFEIVNAPRNVNMGIWLDVLVLDNTYSLRIFQWMHAYRIRFWQMLRLTKTYLGNVEGYWFVGKGRWYLCKKIAKYFTCSSIDNKIRSIKKELNVGEYVASFSIKKKISTIRFVRRKWFGKGVKVTLEGMEVVAPQNYDAVLAKLYGVNYLVPPSEEKRNSGHGDLILDANRPYIRYRNLLCPGCWKNEAQEKVFVLFGSGQQANYFIEHEDKQYMPKYIVDNNSAKWGTTLHDIPIISPQELSELDKDKLRVVIANIYWKEISVQLDELGIYDYYSYVNSAAWEKK